MGTGARRYGGVSRDVPEEVGRYQRWLRERGLADHTPHKYGLRILAFSRYLIRDHRVGLLACTEDMISDYRETLKVGKRSVQQYLSILAGFYRWANSKGLIAVNPMADVPLPKVSPGRPRPIPEHHLVTAVLNAPERVKPWLFLAAGCGLRACEISRLRREDVLDHEAVPVLMVWGKGDKWRVVPLSPQVLAELHLDKAPRSGPLFPRHDGRKGANTPQRISDITNEYLHDQGIAETLHQLRHRFGTRAYAHGKDLRAVQELMGHNSPNTTAGYVALTDTAAADTVVGAQLVLPKGVEFPSDAPGREVVGAPDGPVRPSVLQGEPPTALRGGGLPERRLELPEQQRRADYHQVRKPRTVPARVVVVERQESPPGALPLYQSQEGGFVHLMVPVRRSGGRVDAEEDRPRVGPDDPVVVDPSPPLDRPHGGLGDLAEVPVNLDVGVAPGP